jgi:hypothetical protein
VTQRSANSPQEVPPGPILADDAQRYRERVSAGQTCFPAATNDDRERPKTPVFVPLQRLKWRFVQVEGGVGRGSPHRVEKEFSGTRSIRLSLEPTPGARAGTAGEKRPSGSYCATRCLRDEGLLGAGSAAGLIVPEQGVPPRGKSPPPSDDLFD